MKRMVVLAVALAVAAGTWTLAGRAARKESKLMREKLQQAQKVLEGISLADYKKIRSGAERLIEISKEAEMRSALSSPQYEVYSAQFRRLAGNLVEKANEKNLDGAALNYVELTLTCVQCHKHVREVRMARR